MSKKAVWKFQFVIKDQFMVTMPCDAEILSVQLQGDMVCAWALCDVEAPKETRNFVCVGTGDAYPDRFYQGLRFVATVQTGQLVWHYFEEKRS